MKFVIFYSKENEINNIKEIFDEKDWYLKHNYRVFLPKNLSLDNSSLKPEEIMQLINEEYREADYRLAAEFIKTKESWIDSAVTKAFQEIDKVPEERYEIYLTKYGVGGSYELPNKIGLDIKKDQEGLIKTLIHEIFHLSIEHEILKYKINHFSKERIVNLLMEKLLPEINKPAKNLPDEIKKIVDPVFHKYYPDIEKVIFLVSKIPS